MKKILILGGTGFVGRILTSVLLNSGYDVTLFNRGKRNPMIFKDVKSITGDRNTDDINKIATGNWDVVIDFSGMLPPNIERIAQLLKGKAKRYIFISTASVYDFENEYVSGLVDEAFKLLDCNDEQRNTTDYNTFYGNKKAECERILLSQDWFDVIIFRPALIYGRFDWSDRFYYWLYRSKFSDKILIPDEGRCRSTNTYADDFAGIIKYAVEIPHHRSIYNATTHQPLTLKKMLDFICTVLETNPQCVSVTSEILIDKKIQPWSDIPIWTGDFELLLDNSKLLNDFELKLNSFEKTVVQTAEYFSSLNWPLPKYGLSLEMEKKFIELYSIGT